MPETSRPRRGTASALAALGAVALLVCGAAAASPNGGHGGGGYGGGGHGGGGHNGAAHAAGHGAPAVRGGGPAHFAGGHYYAGGPYRPHGWHGAVGGHAASAAYYRGPVGVRPWHGYGGWWSGRWWGGGYYGYGYGLGLYFAALPLYYETIWWGGVPYYYADYTFYRWNDGVARYEVVAPPAEDGGAPEPAAAEPYVYPRDGQSAEQQQRDRYDCHRWAADQTHFDPTHSNGGVDAAAAPAAAGAYRRAESACLAGRGYTVR
jgi:hypothetical protein